MNALHTLTEQAPSPDLDASLVFNAWVQRTPPEEKNGWRSVANQIRAWLHEAPATPLHISHTEASALPDLEGPWTELQHLVVTDCKHLSALPSPRNAPAVKTLRLHGCAAYGAQSNLHLADPLSCAAFLQAAHAISVWEGAAPHPEADARLAIANQLRLALVNETQGHPAAPLRLDNCPVSSWPDWLPKNFTGPAEPALLAGHTSPAGDHAVILKR
jgi:hypothetical protein